MADNVLFEPNYNSAQTMSTSATSTTVSLPDTKNSSLCVTNLSAVVIYVRVSNSSSTVATTKDLVVLPNNQILIRKPASHTYVHAVSSTAGTLHVIDGVGV